MLAPAIMKKEKKKKKNLNELRGCFLVARNLVIPEVCAKKKKKKIVNEIKGRKRNEFKATIIW